MALASRSRPASPPFLTANLLPTFGNVIFVCLLALFATKFGSGFLTDADTGYHIRAGEIILDTWTIPRQDPFSYHMPALPWTAHEWLSEVIMASIHSLFGLTGVVLFFAVLLAATYWLFYRFLRSLSDDVILCFIVTVLATAASSSHWLARPHIFSLALILVWYHLLDRFQYKHERTLIYLPAIMLLWVNLHGGYIMGLLLLGIYLAGNLVYAAFAAPAEAADARVKATLLCWCAAAAVAAALINPFGYKILFFPFELVGDRLIMDNVKEFKSPNFHGPLPFKYMLLATIAAVALARSPLNLIQCGLLTLLTYMALYSARHMSLYAIIAAPILVKAAESAIARFPVRGLEFYRRRNDNLNAVDAHLRGYLWPGLAVISILSLAYAGNLRYGFNESTHPLAAVEFLRREPIGGKMFNNDEFGDYLIYAAWPQYRVFVDGRNDMYRADYLRPYMTVASALPGWQKVLDRFDIDWVFFGTRSPLTAALTEQTGWKPIYSDTVATIFVRNSPSNQSLLAKYPDVTVLVRPDP